MAPKAQTATPGKKETKATAAKKAANAKAQLKAVEKAAAELPKVSHEDADLEDGEDGEGSDSLTPSLQRGSEEAAATSAVTLTQKNFRNHPDMENFFRFIYENDLRLEALQIIDEIWTERQSKRASVVAKKS